MATAFNAFSAVDFKQTESRAESSHFLPIQWFQSRWLNPPKRGGVFQDPHIKVICWFVPSIYSTVIRFHSLYIRAGYHRDRKAHSLVRQILKKDVHLVTTVNHCKSPEATHGAPQESRKKPGALCHFKSQLEKARDKM